MRVFEPNGTRPVLLALRTLGLGDLLVAVPALHALRRAHPDHDLVLAAPGWLAPIIDLVEGWDEILPTPGLDELLPVPPGRVDVAVNLHGNGPESRALIDGLGARRKIVHRSEADPGHVEWLDGIHERRRWARLVAEHESPADPEEVAIRRPELPSAAPGAAVVHVGAAYGARAWPVERFALVAQQLLLDGYRVVVSGGPADVARAGAVAELADMPPEDVLAGRTDLTELAALVADAAVVCTADTGAAHLASAYGTPSVIVFGAAPVSEWGPPAGPHIALTDDRVRRGDVFAADPDPALLAVTAADVIRAAHAVVRQPTDRG